MIELIAQSGSGGNWINPGTIKVVFWIFLLSMTGIGVLIKKAKEARAKRDAVLRRQNRDEQVLRTGRSDGAAPALPNVASPTMRPSTAEDARKKLQELAERRRRELAEMMRRAQEAKGGAGPRPAPPTIPQARPQPRPIPQPMRASPAPPVRSGQVPQASRNIITAPRTMAEENARRKQQAEAKRRAEKEAAAKRKVIEQQEARRDAATRQQRDARETPSVAAAYALPSDTQRSSPALAARQSATSDTVGAALARVGGATSANEWRKAIVLSELLHPPLALRPPDQRAM